MQVLLIILDGLGDRPSPLLGEKTPLEAAPTPNLDRLAALGVTGLMTPLSPGVALGTPTAHFLLFGYRLDEFPGRSLFLAVAHGLDPSPKEVLCAARFATVEPTPRGLHIIERLLNYGEEDGRPLARAIAHWERDGLTFEFCYTGRSEGLLFLRGENASPWITDSDPLGKDLPVIRIQPLRQAPDPEQAHRTARALNAYLRWVHHTWREHPVNHRRVEEGLLPANFLLTKWTARRRPLEPFDERWGFRAASITSEGILKGVVLELGMEHIPMPAGHDPETDLRNRLRRARQLLEEGYDFIHLHTKEPDVTSHYGDPRRKAEVIAALDRGLEPLLEEFLPDPNLVVVVTADHCTPSVWHTPPGQFHDHHSGEAVPIVALSPYARVDDVDRFDERAVLRGGLGQIRSADLMPLLLNLAGRTNPYSQRPLDHPVLYRPQEVVPFDLRGDEEVNA